MADGPLPVGGGRGRGHRGTGGVGRGHRTANRTSGSRQTRVILGANFCTGNDNNELEGGEGVEHMQATLPLRFEAWYEIDCRVKRLPRSSGSVVPSQLHESPVTEFTQNISELVLDSHSLAVSRTLEGVTSSMLCRLIHSHLSNQNWIMFSKTMHFS